MLAEAMLPRIPRADSKSSRVLGSAADRWIAKRGERSAAAHRITYECDLVQRSPRSGHDTAVAAAVRKEGHSSAADRWIAKRGEGSAARHRITYECDLVQRSPRSGHDTAIATAVRKEGHRPARDRRITKCGEGAAARHRTASARNLGEGPGKRVGECRRWKEYRAAHSHYGGCRPDQTSNPSHSAPHDYDCCGFGIGAWF